MESFNLCDEPWIPIAGECKKRSLTEIFGDPHCPELSGNAVDKTVILRFLLCIVHASTKIADDDAWQALTIEQISKNALAYLKKWHDRFDLYGEKPFLQFPALAKKGGNPISLGRLEITMGSNNNAALTQWHFFNPPSKADKAILLLRSSCYASGGKKSQNSLMLANNYVKKSTGVAGTLLGKNGYLHSFLIGNSLLETLKFNLLTEENIRESGAFLENPGIPFWENMPVDECGPRAQEYRRSYMGILFPLDKYLLLAKDDQVIITDGISYSDTEIYNPTLTTYQNKKESKTLEVDLSRKPWRELSSILSFAENKDKKCFSFLSLGWQKIMQGHLSNIRVWCGGLQIAIQAGEQYVSGQCDYLESVFSFPIHWMNNLRQFNLLMEYLNTCAKKLHDAVYHYRTYPSQKAGNNQEKINLLKN